MRSSTGRARAVPCARPACVSSTVVPTPGALRMVKSAVAPYCSVSRRATLFRPTPVARPRRSSASVAPAPLSRTVMTSRRVVAAVLEARLHHQLAAAPLGCDAVLDGVLDDRLQQQRRQPERPQRLGHRHQHAQPLLESGALDLQIRLDQLELTSERRHLALGPQHAAQQRGQTHQRVERALRRRLNQVADRRQRVEQEVRVDLRSQRAQLRFGGELADLLFADPPVVSLAGDADRIDAASDHEGDGFEKAVVV